MKRSVALAWALGTAMSSAAIAQPAAPATSTLLVPRPLQGVLDFVDPGSGLRLASIALDTAPRRVATSPDGRLAAVLGCRESASGPAARVTVSIVALEQPQELRRFELGTMPCPTALAWPVADGVRLTADAEGLAIVIDPDAGRVLPARTETADGADGLRQAGTFDTHTAAVQRHLAEGGRIEDLAVSPVIPRAVCHACTPDP